MKRILVTGATGNVGSEVIHYLFELNKNSEIVAAVRDIDSAKNNFLRFSDLIYRHFDFEDESSFNSAFRNINILFLLRPPHISDVEKFFKPLLKAAKKQKIEKIVFGTRC